MCIPKCVVALPRGGGGANEFRDRVLRLIPDLPMHWFAGGVDLGDRLRALYQHRNDCVHGKLPFESLHQSGDAGSDKAARFEFLAELVARQAVLYAIKNPAKYIEFADRARLEDAWDQKRLP
jgi:hypothetical protein